MDSADRTAKPPVPQRLLKREEWPWEFVALLGAVLSLSSTIILLITQNGHTVFDWNGITLNAIVSILSVTMKATMGYALAECISQWKWILFYSKGRRRLIDFERIDEVSRGLWGSFDVLLIRGDW